MRSDTQVATQVELQALLEFTERVGSNPLLTQASTGNTSIKLDGVLWIKASGKWMADALQEEILTPLLLADVQGECLQRDVDPAGQYPDASLETAMHAVLPQRVVVHVHCVNTIAWAVRSDARTHLQERLAGLRWHWIPYVASGLPLSREIQGALSARGAEVFVLGNHGLVIAGEDRKEVEDLLGEVGRRLAIRPRQAHPADYTALAEISEGSPWDLPDDDAVHGLGTDKLSQAVLSGGLLYPCRRSFQIRIHRRRSLRYRVLIFRGRGRHSIATGLPDHRGAGRAGAQIHDARRARDAQRVGSSGAAHPGLGATPLPDRSRNR